jgi:hypothetical protein
MTSTIPQDMPFAFSTASPRGRTRPVALPVTLRLTLLTLFLPEAMSFYIADLRLTLTRLIFLIMASAVIRKFAAHVTAPSYRLVASDLFVVAASVWMFVGPSVTYGLADSLVHSGPIVLEYMIAYLATRVLVRDEQDVGAFVSLLCLVISVVAWVALLDTVTGRYFTRELSEQLTGYQKVWHVADETRFGLLRAAGPVEHPILFGVICAAGLLLSIAANVRWKPLCILSCLMGLLISLSSAPEQAAVMGLGLYGYGAFLPRAKKKWLLLSVIPIITIVGLFTSTPTPFGHIFDLLTIDPATAYFRLYIWNSVGPAILDQPFFAVLPTGYDYAGSVDSVWLVLSLEYGMVCSVLAGLSLIGACSYPTNRYRSGLSKAGAGTGMALGIIIFLIIYLGFTVHFWGSTWILIGLLTGLRARLGEIGRLVPCR